MWKGTELTSEKLGDYNYVPISSRFQNLKYGVYLSTASVILGIGREFLIVGLLGLSSINDQLQTYLSVTYIISMLGEAIRLATFNLLRKINFGSIVAATFIVSISVSLILTFFFVITADEVVPIFLFLAFTNGLLNLFVALYVAFYQFNNRFLLAQIVSVFPNFILIPGIIFIYFCRLETIVSMLCLFAMVPVVQMIVLILYKPQSALLDQGNLLKNTGIILSQGLQCFGNQIFQLTFRVALLGLGEGYLSLMTLLIKVVDSLKSILVDTYIGFNVFNWREEGITTGKITIGKQWSIAIVLILAISISITFVTSSNIFIFAVQATTIILLGFLTTTLYRVMYYKINIQEVAIVLVIIFGFIDLLFAFGSYLLEIYAIASILTIMWFWYILKPSLQISYLSIHQNRRD